MCKEQYTIGVDYGSLSARGVLVRVRDGEIAAEAEFAYPHGIITGALPDGTPLPGDWFLEHPQDYLDAMSFIVPRLRSPAFRQRRSWGWPLTLHAAPWYRWISRDRRCA